MRMGEHSVERVSGDVWRVRVDLTNERLIPTITARGAENRVVRPDLLTLEGADVVMAGWVQDDLRREPLERIEQEELGRIMIRTGHPGRTTRTVEYLVRGSGTITVTYDSVKGGTVSRQIPLG